MLQNGEKILSNHDFSWKLAEKKTWFPRNVCSVGQQDRMELKYLGKAKDMASYLIKKDHCLQASDSKIYKPN